MGFYNAYKAKLSVSPNNTRSYNQLLTTSLINNTFSDSLSYYEVLINQSSSPIGVQIVDDSKMKEQKKVLMKPDDHLNFGDLIKWDDDYWITLIVDNMGDIYKRGVIQKCVSSLRWLDSKGFIKEAWFTYRLDFYRGAGVSDGKTIPMPQERRYLFVQNNLDTVLLEKGKRFIFDGRVWKLTAIDRLITGLIYLELEENEINKTNDNLELRIADYYGKVADFKVNITNKELSSIYLNSSYQLNVTVTNRGDAISVPVKYLSSDDSIASINENGVITPHTKGQITFTAEYENAYDALTVNVFEQMVNNYSVEIMGSHDIRYNATLKYLCSFKNNGYKIEDISEFWLTGEDGNTQTKLASIISQDSELNICTIKAAKTSGFFILHAKNKNGLISNSVRIQVKSMLEN